MRSVIYLYIILIVNLENSINLGKQIVHSVNHLLWPAACLSCRRSISENSNGLCKNCWTEMLTCVGGDYCPRCGCDVSRYAIVEGTCPRCQGLKIHFDKIARAGIYSGSLRNMILKFKHDRTELRESLGGLINSALQASTFANDIDMLVPVPLHWLRRLTRGYNQSLLIAKQLKPRGVKIKGVINDDLVRIRNTKQQAGCTTFTKRAKNVAGAFAVRKSHPFTGKNVCLVDDIKTSGATLNECARVLKQAGAAKVYAAVITIAGQDSR